MVTIEVTDMVRSAEESEKRYSVTENKILPPSKELIGNKLSIPRKTEEIFKIDINSVEGNMESKAKRRKFIAGPEMLIKISSRILPMLPFGISEAPKGDNRNSLNLTRRKRAAAM